MIQKIPDLKEAIDLWNAQRHEEARRLLEELVRVRPRSEKAWLWLARVTVERERQYQALQKVLEINPGNPVAQRIIKERFSGKNTAQLTRITDLLGEAAFLDNWQQSEAIYFKILEIDPVQKDALEALTDHYAHVLQWSKGFRLLANARKRASGSDDELVKLTVKYGIRSQNLDYLRSLDELLLTHPAMTVQYLLKVSELFATAKQYPVVVMLLERGAEIEPDNQTVLYG
ncbi:MAG TPA: hypothetical protein VJZ27_02710, partial [Aggregatilineales bacterium]|nr:hypothetical protein [Aggregatilineales bacterium]